MTMLNVVLRLGRVSNLPTVWSNVLAGMVLAGGGALGSYLSVTVALSLLYISGMWLNDAFDARIDQTLAPERPIPAGEISRGMVFAGGAVFMALGMVVLLPFGSTVLLAGLGLALTIILYDWLHKKTPLAPVIMGGTRFFCYLIAALAAGGGAADAFWPAIGLFAYVVGLTYAAKQEAFNKLEAVWPLAVLALPFALLLLVGATSGLALGFLVLFGAAVMVALWFLFRRRAGDVRRAVILMIAGMSLLDAAWIALAGQTALALVACAFFAATLGLQRVVSGT